MKRIKNKSGKVIKYEFDTNKGDLSVEELKSFLEKKGIKYETSRI